MDRAGDFGEAGLDENGAQEEPVTAPIWIRLPDDQQILGRLSDRFQSDSGAWYYQVSVSLWSIVHDSRSAKVHSEPYDVSFAVPATHVRPVDGTDYSPIPVRRSRAALVRARTGRSPTRTPAPAAAPEPEEEAGDWPPVRGDDTDRWYVHTPLFAADAPPPSPTEVHHIRCWVGTESRALTTAEALQALAQPGATACTVCGADQLHALSGEEG